MVAQREMNHLINHLAERMRAKLNEPRNLAKMTWCEQKYAYLCARLYHEVTELSNALGAGLSNEEVWSEAVDVAAFAMFIADKFEQEESCLSN
jgi:NTP pyrophosphatase (non-canonical NTP hydrolase)